MFQSIKRGIQIWTEKASKPLVIPGLRLNLIVYQFPEWKYWWIIASLFNHSLGGEAIAPLNFTQRLTKCKGPVIAWSYNLKKGHARLKFSSASVKVETASRYVTESPAKCTIYFFSAKFITRHSPKKYRQWTGMLICLISLLIDTNHSFNKERDWEPDKSRSCRIRWNCKWDMYLAILSFTLGKLYSYTSCWTLKKTHPTIHI